jgi:hypothetical protein
MVVVRPAASNEKAVYSFRIGNTLGTITESAITLTLPYGTNLSSLSPEIGYTGSSVRRVSGTAGDFTGPVIYRVTAGDGSTRDYTVTLATAPSDVKFISSFTIGTIGADINDQTIIVTVPFGTAVTALAPEVVFVGHALNPASGQSCDFTSPVVYRVSADDGSVKDYTVVVRHAPSGEKAIASFKIGNTLGIITASAITVTLPFGTDINHLSPVIQHIGSSVSPASGVEQNFAGQVTYRVTAGDGSTRDYTVTVRLEGRAPISVTFAPLPSQEIDLTPDTESNLSRKLKDTLEIGVSEEDSTPVRWFVDGEELLLRTDRTITLRAVDFPIGLHHVTALVYRAGIPYSGELVFRVVE